MPTTRKKVIKTVYKDDDDSEGDVGDFSDSGSEAQISEESNSEDEEEIEQPTSEDEFVDKNKKKKIAKPVAIRKPISLKTLISKVHKQSHEENSDITPSISVKDLTEEDKLLPSLLNLSESDSSDDEFTTVSPNKIPVPIVPSTSSQIEIEPENEKETELLEYKDVWSNNIQDNGDDIAKKTFMELQEHNTKIEETKATIQKYTNQKNEAELDIKDLLAQGEEILPKEPPIKKKSRTKKKVDSDSEVEDWEEVKETKSIPQQGLQLFVEFSDAARKKKKAIDVEMMMKRKLNRVKKENQVYMHKVHILCWLGHGNFISRILNDQELMSAALSLVPSKECYPGERVDLKYIEQITSWYRDKLTLKQDKNEDKFKPKAPHLNNILQSQIKSRVVTSKKYMVFIFVIMLRALGLQCRVMFNFVAVPLKPPISELCSLSTKPAQSAKDKKTSSKDINKLNIKKKCSSTANIKSKQKKVPQLDGNYDFLPTANLIQLDGSNDDLNSKQKPVRSTRANKNKINNCSNENQDMSPPKKLKRNPVRSTTIVPEKEDKEAFVAKLPQKTTRKLKNNTISDESLATDKVIVPEQENVPVKTTNLRRTRGRANKDNSEKVVKITQAKVKQSPEVIKKQNKLKPPKITVTNENQTNVASTYFEKETANKSSNSKLRLSRKRTYSAGSNSSQAESTTNTNKSNKAAKTRTKSAPGTSIKESKYFNNKQTETSKKTKATASAVIKQEASPEQKRVSHRDLLKSKPKPKNDVTDDLIQIITNRMKEESPEKQKGRMRKSTNDPDFKLGTENESLCMDSDDDFKPTKLSPKPSTSKVIDRRVLSSDEDTASKKTDVWCEIFVEELEQWICVDLITGKIHDANFIYNRCTHPVCYIVGWDNNNYLKDLTRRYVPHWNTITRKLRAEQGWWDKAVQPWLGPKTARQREEDEFLDKMQLDAPIPKSIAEYKNHPLYALKRHLLKFEAIYPPDAATLGFVRGEPVYARECVYVCRSRDTWLKEAKVVRIGEEPYKVVKARPKWDKLSNKLITDKPLEVFGPWQVKDYEPPVAENGIVPRNAYGNVELFKDCMLPKGTVHIKLPGLNKVARKLNIDCAPAMTGFDFNGGWSHPVFDGFVVCKEYEEIITEAWVKDQEEQEKREREKTDARVYGNWRKLIKGLLIRERIKNKYGFENPTTSQANKNKAKTPRFVAKKNNK